LAKERRRKERRAEGVSSARQSKSLYFKLETEDAEREGKWCGRENKVVPFPAPCQSDVREGGRGGLAALWASKSPFNIFSRRGRRGGGREKQLVLYHLEEGGRER